MSQNEKQPSIIEVFHKFNTEEKCIRHFERLRWPDGAVCPKCGSKRVSQVPGNVFVVTSKKS